MAFVAPLISAISSAIASAATFMGRLGWVGKVAFTIGFNTIGNLLTKKKAKKRSKNNDTQLGGTNLTFTSGGAKPREIGVGLFATAGQEIFACAFGDGNKTLARVIQLSDFLITSVTRILIDDEWCSLTGDNNSDRGFGVTGKHKDFIRIKLYDGSQTNADDYLIKNSGGQWTSNHIGTGLAYAIVYMDYDQNEMSNPPQMLFEGQGKCYDPRFDSTYGGAGPQRWENPTTWGYSDNPIVQAYNYERGFYINGQFVIGKDLSPADLPIQKWVEAMNLCDEMVGTEKRYRSGMIFSAGEGVQHKDNLEPLFSACAGALLEGVDGDIPIVGIVQPIVATLTEDDLISRETFTYTPKRSSSQLVNAVHGTYNEPEKSWEAVAYPAQLDDAALAADGSHHGTQLDFKAVFIASQAVRLARSALRENRYQKQYNMVVRPLWRKLEVGDWVNFYHKRYGKGVFRVVSRSLTPISKQGSRNVNLALQEVGAGIYDDSVEIPELSPNKPAPRPVFQNFPDDFKAIASQAISQDDKRRIPVFDLTWRQPKDVTVTGILIEYWQTTEPTRKLNHIVHGSQTAVRISGFAPETSYTFRATVIPEPSRTTLWSQEVIAVSKGEDFNIDLEEIREKVSAGNEWAFETLNKVQQELDYLASIVADTAAAGFQATDGLRQTIDVKMAQNDASYTKQITVALSETKAIAARIEAVEVNVNNNIAQSINEIRAEINEKGQATAESLSALNAKVGEVSSNITMRAQAIAGEGSGSARFVLQLRSGTATNWKSVSMQMDTDGIYFDANRFFFTSGNGQFVPASLVDGVWRSNFADIGRVTAGELNINNSFKVARDGTVEISGYAGSGRTVLTNNRYEVYDNNGRIRVQLGLWKWDKD